jgi:hypothetical protein
MKLSMVAIALTFVAVVVVGPVVVHADRMVRYLFNKGVDDASAGSCNAVDYGKIDTIFTNSAKPSTYGKRNLLRSESTTDLHENEYVNYSCGIQRARIIVQVGHQERAGQPVVSDIVVN